MTNKDINSVLCGYAVTEHKHTGFMIATKQIVPPEKEFVMRNTAPGMTWEKHNGIMLPDCALSLKGGRRV